MQEQGNVLFIRCHGTRYQVVFSPGFTPCLTAPLHQNYSNSTKYLVRYTRYDSGRRGPRCMGPGRQVWYSRSGPSKAQVVRYNCSWNRLAQTRFTLVVDMCIAIYLVVCGVVVPVAGVAPVLFGWRIWCRHYMGPLTVCFCFGINSIFSHYVRVNECSVCRPRVSIESTWWSPESAYLVEPIIISRVYNQCVGINWVLRGVLGREWRVVWTSECALKLFGW